MLATTIGIYVLYNYEKGNSDTLKENLKTAQHKLSALQDEKDVLMVRLALAESKAGDKPPERNSDLNQPVSETPVNERFAETKPMPEGDTHKAISLNANDTEKRSTDVDTSDVVDIEKFNTRYDTKDDMLRIEFILKKTNATTNKVSGRAFVVLKSDGSEIDPLVIPAATLRSGRPSQTKRGQYFSIAHFKWMNFKKKFPPPIKSFNYATVFVFSTEGKLLLEKDITIGEKL
jgi:hypothetical protein